MSHPHTTEHLCGAKLGDAVLPIPDVVGGKSFLWHDTLKAHGWNQLKPEDKLLRVVMLNRVGGVIGVTCPALPQVGELDVFPNEVRNA